MKIVLASHNRGKLAELQAILAPLGMDLVRQAELGIGEAEEPRVKGQTLCSYSLQRAFEEARRLWRG